MPQSKATKVSTKDLLDIYNMEIEDVKEEKKDDKKDEKPEFESYTENYDEDEVLEV